MSEWISVTERLPEKPEHDWVLVQIKLIPEGWYGVPCIAELRDGKWYSDHNDGPIEEIAGIKVTHWMPLPSKPDEVTSKPESPDYLIKKIIGGIKECSDILYICDRRACRNLSRLRLSPG